MSSIDNRIVEMEFDNSQFEKGVATTMNSLSGLDDKLNGLGSGNGFGSLANSVDTIADRFSTMGVVAMSILDNITNRVVNLGINMAKSITIDQVAEGMQKYESITTNTMALVNQADITYDKAAEYVKKLAWYSDATSFSLSNMVSGLQAFARQGISLDKAIPTIMGIGNSVTYAGQSAKEGSRAFDIYAQALAKGGLSLMEWRRLGYLGVSTAKLKQQFLDAAVAVGTLKKVSEDTYTVIKGEGKGTAVTLESFERTLTGMKGGWASTEVIMKVLGEGYGKYTNELADATLEYQKQNGVVLTLDEAMEKLGDQSNKLGKIYLQSATKARTFTEAIDAAKDATSTAFYQIAQAIFGTPEEAVELWTALNDFLVTNFSQPIVDVANIFGNWHDEGGRDEFIQALKDIYHAVETYLEPIKNVIDDIIPDLSADSLLDFTKKLSEFAKSISPVNLSESAKSIAEIGDAVKNHFDKKYESFIPEFPNPIKNHNEEKYMQFADAYMDTLEKADELSKKISTQERIVSIINGIGDALNTLKDILIAVVQPFKRLKEPIGYFADGMLTVASNTGNFISSVTEGGKVVDWFKNRMSPLEKVIDFVGNAIKWLTDRLVEFSSSKTIGKAIDGIGKLVDGFHPLQSLFEFGAGIFISIANGIKKIGKSISETLTPVFGSGNSGSIISKSLIAILAIRKALETKGSFEFWKQLAKGVENFRLIIENASDALESFVAGTRMKAFKEMAISIGIMAVSLLVLASISYENLAKGLAAVAVSIRMLQMSFKALNVKDINGRNSLMNAGSLLAISAAVLVLAGAIKILSKLDLGSAIQGLVGISILLWELVGVLAVTQKFGKASLTNLIALSNAVLILTASVAVLGLINKDALIQGGIAIAAILVALLGFMGVLQNIDTKGFTVAMLGVVELSAALVVMSTAVIALGLIPWDNMVKGLAGIAALLAEIGIFAAVFKNMPGKFVALGAGMVLIAAAFAGLAVSLMAIASLGLDNMTNSLIGLGIALAEIGVFTYLLAGLGPSMLVLGVALTAMSAGILVLSAAFAVLAAIGLPGIGTALLAVLGALLLFGTAGAIIGGAAVVGMLAFAAGLAAISAALIVLGNALIKIATACLIFKTAFGQTSTDVTNQFTKSSDEISKSAKNVEENVTTSAGNIEKAVTESNDAIETDVESTNTEIESSTSQSWLNMIQSVTGGTVDIQGLTNGMSTNVLGTFSDMNTGSVAETDAMTGSITDLFSQMNTDGSSEVDGMKTNVTEYFSGMGEDLTKQTSGIGSNLSISWKSIGHNLMEGLKQGIRNKWNNLLDTMASLGNQMQNTYQYTMGIYSPSRVFAKYGEYIDQGLINGLNSYSGRVMNATENLGESVLNSFSDPMKQVASIANSDFTISPKITPVLDTTNIQNGKNYLDSMLNGRTLSSSINGNINANLSAMSGISGDIGSLKNEIARMVAGQLNETVLSQALANAMKNVDLYMDGAKVGKMITSYQSSVNRAGGI